MRQNDGAEGRGGISRPPREGAAPPSAAPGAHAARRRPWRRSDHASWRCGSRAGRRCPWSRRACGSAPYPSPPVTGMGRRSEFGRRTSGSGAWANCCWCCCCAWARSWVFSRTPRSSAAARCLDGVDDGLAAPGHRHALDDDPLLAPAPVAPQGLELQRGGPQQLDRQVAAVLYGPVVLPLDGAAEEVHRRLVHREHLHAQRRLGLVAGRRAVQDGQGGVEGVRRDRLTGAAAQVTPVSWPSRCPARASSVVPRAALSSARQTSGSG
jgi:hypothetical protein